MPSFCQLWVALMCPKYLSVKDRVTLTDNILVSIVSLTWHVNLITDMIDECATSLHDCHVNAVCTDMESGYTCACNQPYIGNGRACIAMACELCSIAIY